MWVEGFGSKKKWDMNQCLRCNKLCSATSVFCDECRSLRHNQLEPEEPAGTDVSAVMAPPVVTLPATPSMPQTPPSPAYGAYADVVEQAIHKLNDAAQRIAEVEQGSRRAPRVSRLAPLRDISADIRRDSTPLPNLSNGSQSKQNTSQKRNLPDLWPWFQDPDESENDAWTNHTDPLLSRRFPDSAESARIEEEDMRRARAAGVATTGAPIRRSRKTYMQIAFGCLVLLAVLALVVDGVLAFAAFLHPHRTTHIAAGPPTLTLSSNQATYGQSITVHIRNFSPSAYVVLTHDIQEPILTSNGTASIRVDSHGSMDVPIVIDSGIWEPGFHNIEAEEIKTHYTANATLQIVGSGRSQPPHLLINPGPLNFGAAVQGANTIQHFKLSNSGGGAITWAASSNQPWLVLTPNQGIFSSSEMIVIGVERANLPPKDYKGKIMFSSNVGAPQSVMVEMTVRPLPANPGAVLSITPAVLSFIALDGGGDPAAQELVVSNPGSQPLSWSLTNNVPNTPTPFSGQNDLLRPADLPASWLSLGPISGVVVPGATAVIYVNAHSQSLLPGNYINTLVFSASQGTLNTPQNVSISLTVQPHCGLTLGTGSMSFIAVSGQSNPSNQALGLASTASCPSTINWSATSSANWLTITPASGLLTKSATNAVITVGVNAIGLRSNTYAATINLIAGQSTQSVMVSLTVQPPPPPNAPIMGVSQLSLNFSTTQGQANPPAQVVTITNTGGSALQWHTSINLLAASWLNASPTGGSIAAGQTGQVEVNVITGGLTPGTYVGQVTLSGVDANNMNAGGSPQTITVNLLVLPPCTLAQPSSSALAFSATKGAGPPQSQSVTITASGNCGWPLSWKASSSAGWLKVTPSSGSFSASGQAVILSVAPSLAGLKPNTYNAQVSITATDVSNQQALGSPQIFSVSLTVLQTCSFQVAPSTLSFTVPQGQLSSTTQNLALSASGSCARPVSWTAAGDGGSSTWLTLSQTSGTNNGTVGVGVNASTLVPGTYNGYITVFASGNGGATIQNSSQTIPVTLTVTGFTISGVVHACIDITCASPAPLPNATLSLTTSSSSGTVISVIADASGNFTITNVPLGTYTVSVSGNDANAVHYVGTTSLSVTGDQKNVSINTYPGP